MRNYQCETAMLSPQRHCRMHCQLLHAIDRASAIVSLQSVTLAGRGTSSRLPILKNFVLNTLWPRGSHMGDMIVKQKHMFMPISDMTDNKWRHACNSICSCQWAMWLSTNDMIVREQHMFMPMTIWLSMRGRYLSIAKWLRENIDANQRYGQL